MQPGAKHALQTTRAAVTNARSPPLPRPTSPAQPHARKEEDEIPGLSLTAGKKKETKTKEETPKEKPKKQVSQNTSFPS
jgi:hypothetical protein